MKTNKQNYKHFLRVLSFKVLFLQWRKWKYLISLGSAQFNISFVTRLWSMTVYMYVTDNDLQRKKIDERSGNKVKDGD